MREKASFVLALLLVSAFAFAQVVPSRSRLDAPASFLPTTVNTANPWLLCVGPCGGASIAYSVAGGWSISLSNGAAGLTIDNGTGKTTSPYGFVGSLTTAAPVTHSDFVDDSATTGNRTVNASRGFNAYAAAATAITITNSNVTTSSQIYATIMTNDATAVLKNCVPAAGSFTCNLNAAATGITKIAWTVGK